MIGVGSSRAKPINVDDRMMGFAGVLPYGLPAPRRRNRQLPLVARRADFERRLGEPGHEPLEMHDPLSGQVFMQLGDLPGFGDERFAHLFCVVHLKLKGLDG